MLGVFEPDFGFLTDRMLVDDGAAVSLARAGLIQPRAEGEIAFMLQSDLVGPGVTREQVLAATAWVAPCFEIVDSRIRDWKIRIQEMCIRDRTSTSPSTVPSPATSRTAARSASRARACWSRARSTLNSSIGSNAASTTSRSATS